MLAPRQPLQRAGFLERRVWIATLLFAVGVPAEKLLAQTSRASMSAPAESVRREAQSLTLDTSLTQPPDSPLGSPPLFDLAGSHTKFGLDRLMTILRDRRHEGWVRTAYPDPQTGRPLIGGGFSLDLSGTVHMQLDPRNPNSFIEPSSAQLWRAAGLDPAELDSILDQFRRRQMVWGEAAFRQKIRAHDLPPDVTEEEAVQLLRISTLQAIHNARAYCIDFDKMSASQQMALSQLVFQMGVNLEEFVTFLAVINGHPGDGSAAQNHHAIESVDWRSVQRSLVQSQWARHYPDRAVAVIAMFAPNYDRDPRRAERQVRIWIHPPASHRRGKSQRQFAGRSRPNTRPRQTKRS
jgi:hypothetical protein